MFSLNARGSLSDGLLTVRQRTPETGASTTPAIARSTIALERLRR
jgi:hypothetical protein